MKDFLNKKDGIALISVLLIIPVLLILLTSMVFLLLKSFEEPGRI
jgi:hypothetical protein